MTPTDAEKHLSILHISHPNPIVVKHLHEEFHLSPLATAGSHLSSLFEMAINASEMSGGR